MSRTTPGLAKPSQLSEDLPGERRLVETEDQGPGPGLALAHPIAQFLVLRGRDDPRVAQVL